MTNGKEFVDSDSSDKEGDREKLGRKRTAESNRERKITKVKRQCVTNSSENSNLTLSEKEKKRDSLKRTLEELQKITPNCPKYDIVAILDHAIEYAAYLNFATFFIELQNHV